ncbi:hypothetical protein ACFSUS_05665 [Spirosoma soli]|uniref:Uncharacterized protein n=1 Tax=Spirosoma soli TaxID=1770529 RepID=A0ABW5LZ87_9BACT
MKQKSDESLDQWVRQSLDRLPDAPPPGSAFDTERLWGQMWPQVAATPIGWQRLAGWWIAACVTGLILGVVWIGQLAENKPLATQKPQLLPATPKEKPAMNLTDRQLAQELVSHRQVKPVTMHRVAAKQLIRTKPQPTVHVTEPIAAVAQLVEALITPDTAATSVVAKPVEPVRTIAAKPASRRFRVVHENELRAEEEARPKLYRSEHFVRLGTGSQRAIDDVRPSSPIILPLTTKTNQ